MASNQFSIRAITFLDFVDDITKSRWLFADLVLRLLERIGMAPALPPELPAFTGVHFSAVICHRDHGGHGEHVATCHGTLCTP